MMYIRPSQLDHHTRHRYAGLFALILVVAVLPLSLSTPTAAQTSSAWQIETVDSDGYVGRYSSLALDSSGYPHISYLERKNLDLKYARFDGSQHIAYFQLR